jgi:hypothetical protein
MMPGSSSSRAQGSRRIVTKSSETIPGPGLSFVLRMAREPLRGPPRSVANLEFHRAGHRVDEIGAEIVAKLEARGVRAVNPSMGFPMEMYQAPGHGIWVVSHKPVAVEAGSATWAFTAI